MTVCGVKFFVQAIPRCLRRRVRYGKEQVYEAKANSPFIWKKGVLGRERNDSQQGGQGGRLLEFEGISLGNRREEEGLLELKGSNWRF